MTALPPCEFRVPTLHEAVYYCRHTQVRAVHNLVPAVICGTCTTCALPSASPRPAPTETELRQPPPWTRQLWNVAAAVVAFVADGMQTVSREEFAARLAVCDGCPERRGLRCLQCGCRLTLKAQGHAFHCPLGKWPEQDGTRA